MPHSSKSRAAAQRGSSPSAWRGLGGTTLLGLASLLFSLMIAELLVRTVLAPGDYLQASLQEDDALGHRIAPGTAGHDGFGFRNEAVPESVAIVAIGDSQTYGVSATARDSWPAQLQERLGQNVYNLALGGYGPVHYYYLLENKALPLEPSVVIIAFYFGNDFFDAFSLVYERDRWRHLRRPDFDGASELVAQGAAPANRFMGRARDWLSRHSVAYRAVALTAGVTLRSLEMRLLGTRSDGMLLLEHGNPRIRTELTPVLRLRALDPSAPQIREGMRITFEMFRQMHALCAQARIDCLVTLIPTKESVFADIGEESSVLLASKPFAELVELEARANASLRALLSSLGMPYVDVLPALRAAAGDVDIYPPHDGHPNAAGYRVIAQAVEEFLSSRD